MSKTFNIPENTKSVSVEQTDNKIVIEFIPEEPKFKAGDVVTIIDGINSKIIGIVVNHDNDEIAIRCYINLVSEEFIFSNTNNWYFKGCISYLATEQERQLLFDRIDREGLEYNPETNKLDKKRWKPKVGEVYYTPFSVFTSVWDNTETDLKRFNHNAVFKTREEANEAERRFSELYK